MSLDLDFARSQFPALATGWAFFDNAGGSQVLRPVAERVADYLHHNQRADRGELRNLAAGNATARRGAPAHGDAGQRQSP